MDSPEKNHIQTYRYHNSEYTIIILDLILSVCLTQNAAIDISMPDWYFMQQVATRGSATRQGNVFCNKGSYILPYIWRK